MGRVVTSQKPVGSAAFALKAFSHGTSQMSLNSRFAAAHLMRKKSAVKLVALKSAVSKLPKKRAGKVVTVVKAYKGGKVVALTGAEKTAKKGAKGMVSKKARGKGGKMKGGAKVAKKGSSKVVALTGAGKVANSANVAKKKEDDMNHDMESYWAKTPVGLDRQLDTYIDAAPAAAE